MMRSRVYTSANGGTIMRDLPENCMEAMMADPEMRIWLDLNDPTEEELRFLERDFGILHLTTEDLARQGQRAKFEEFENYDYLVAFDMHFVDNAIATSEVDFLIG